jgi:hypothetical protein
MKRIMKKILLVLLVVTAFTSCENQNVEPNYSIEGKWTIGDRTVLLCLVWQALECVTA